MKTRFFVPVFIWVLLLLCLSGKLHAEDVKLSFATDSLTIGEVFEQIEKQTVYTVAYNNSQIDHREMVILPARNIGLKELLNHILSPLDYVYKITGNHIVISVKKNVPSGSFQPVLSGGNMLCRGVVITEDKEEPLPYATVYLLDESDNILQLGVTNDEGVFSMSSTVYPAFIRITYLGYKAYVDVYDPDKEESYILVPDERMLEDVVVTADKVTYDIDRNKYLVSDQMRQGASTAVEILNKIPGVKFDRMTNEIRVDTDTQVLLLIDGMQQSSSYIRGIDPKRIYQIEIVREPTGRYLSEGYSAIINFILKKDFRGYDLSVHNFLNVHAGNDNGNDLVMMEQPQFSYDYTRNNLSLYGYMAYGRSRWNTYKESSVEYADILQMQSVRGDEPNDIYKYEGAVIQSGLNYQLKPDHVLSGELSFHLSDNQTFTSYDYQLTRQGLPSSKIINSTYDKTKDNTYSGTLFYKGKFNSRFELYGDFSYSYYNNRVINEFTQRDVDIYRMDNRYKEDRNQVLFTIDGSYNFEQGITFNMGYNGAWRRYNSNSVDGEQFLAYDEMRNKMYLYVSYSPHEKVKLKVGTGLEYIHTDNSLVKRGRWNWQPYAQANYKARDWFNMNISYLTDIRYPSLYQLSSMNTAIDSLLMQRGNPNLTTALRHTLKMRFSFWDKLTIVPTFKYTPDRISDYYSHTGEEYIRTFENIKMLQYILQVSWQQEINEKFLFDVSVYPYRDRSSFNGIRNIQNGILFDATASYFHTGIHLGVDLGFSRMLEKSLMLQGYQMVNMDAWMINISKQFPKKNLSIMLTYIPPVSWGVRRDQEKWVDTPFYREKSVYDMNIYKNMLLLRLNMRFKGGEVKRSENKSRIEKEEREKRTMGF